MSRSPAGCLGEESRCKDNNGLSMRTGGGGREKEKEGRGVKGIYCQEPSISGNGYACIGVNQTCCFSSSTAEAKKQQRCNWLQV